MSRDDPHLLDFVSSNGAGVEQRVRTLERGGGPGGGGGGSITGTDTTNIDLSVAGSNLTATLTDAVTLSATGSVAFGTVFRFISAGTLLAIQGTTLGQNHFVLQPTGKTDVRARIEAFTPVSGPGAGPDPQGGMFGDGSNVILNIGTSSLNGQYPDSTGTTQGVSRAFMSITSLKNTGTNGLRNQRTGTITSSGTSVTASTTTFTSADTGKKIWAGVASGGVITWYEATLGTCTTSLTAPLAGVGFVSRAGTAVNITTPTAYTVDPDAVTFTGPVVGGQYANFWRAWNGTALHNTFGSMNMIDVYGTINDVAAGGEAGYGELAGLSSHITCNRQGALTSNEFGTIVNAGKQGRNEAFGAAIEPHDDYSTWTTTIFGTDSPWPQTGARGISVWNNTSNQKSGTGIWISDSRDGVLQGWARALTVNKGGNGTGSPGTDIFTIEGNKGFLGINGPTIDNTGVNPQIASAIHIGYTGGAAGTPVEGITFGTDADKVNIHRSAAGTLNLSSTTTGNFDIFTSVSGVNKWRIRTDTTNSLLFANPAFALNPNHLVFNSDGTTEGRKVLNLKSGPVSPGVGVDPFGGMYGDGSSNALNITGTVSGKYLDEASSTHAGRALMSIGTFAGFNGLRPQGAGTILSSGTSVTGSGTAFTNADKGKKIWAMKLTGGVMNYWTATIHATAAVTATTLTLVSSFVDRLGVAANVPSGASYSIDPDLTSERGPATGWGSGYASFFSAWRGTADHNTYGSCTSIDIFGQINDLADGGVDGYGELAGVSSHLIANRKGSLVTNEFGTTINADSWGRNMAIGASVIPADPYASWNDTTTFGTILPWTVTGACGMQIWNGGLVEAGTALWISDIRGDGGPGWRRAIVVNRAGYSAAGPGTDIFTVDGNTGYLGINGQPTTGPASNQSASTITAALTVGNTGHTKSIGTPGTSFSAGTVTVTTTAAHTLVAGQRIAISGITPATHGLNNTAQIVVATPTSTTFTITAADPGAWTSGGTVNAYQPSEGIRFGTDANAVEIFRYNTDRLRINDSVTIAAAGANPQAGIGPGIFLNNVGTIDCTQTSAAVFRGFQTAGDTKPVIQLLTVAGGTSGIQFGPGGTVTNPDTTLSRSAANLFSMTGGLQMTATSGAAFLEYGDATVTPTAPASGRARVYVRNKKFVVAFNDGGTQKYHWCDLSSTLTSTSQWQVSTTDPA